MESITLVAPDISCEHCQRAIEGTLGQLAGINQVSVDIPSKSIQVSYDRRELTEASIVTALDEIGYTVAS